MRNILLLTQRVPGNRRTGKVLQKAFVKVGYTKADQGLQFGCMAAGGSRVRQ